MASGRSTQLTGQIGEYLVAAELCRRGLIATTFTGNVPHYDIIASDDEGRHVSVQVKANRSSSWQFTATHFVDITMDGKRQVLGKKVQSPIPDLICVFVWLKSYGADRFFVLRWDELTDIVVKHHREYLKRHDFVRPRKPDSFHTAVLPEHIEEFENNWDLITETLKAVR